MYGFENQGAYLPEVDQGLLPVQVEAHMRSRCILLQFPNHGPIDTCGFFLPHRVNSNVITPAQQKVPILTPTMSAFHATSKKTAIYVMLKWAGSTAISTNHLSRLS